MSHHGGMWKEEISERVLMQHTRIIVGFRGWRYFWRDVAARWNVEGSERMFVATTMQRTRAREMLHQWHAEGRG